MSEPRVYWSVEQCAWVPSPPVEVVVPSQREDEPAVSPVREPADA